MEQEFRSILEQIGEDASREGLLDTPGRAARAMEFLTRGYNQTLEQVVNNALFDSNTSEMILVQDIELYSMCEHHMLPFIGKCHVAYVPTGKVLGLSKVARIVDMYARRLQIQENLTKQIAEAIEGNLCRCTGYQQIIDSIEAAAAIHRGDADAAAPASDPHPDPHPSGPEEPTMPPGHAK